MLEEILSQILDLKKDIRDIRLEIDRMRDRQDPISRRVESL